MFAAILAYLISDLEEDGIGGLTVGPTSSLVLLRFVDWVAIVCEEACLPVIVYAAGADAKVEKGKEAGVAVLNPDAGRSAAGGGSAGGLLDFSLKNCAEAVTKREAHLVRMVCWAGREGHHEGSSGGC